MTITEYYGLPEGTNATMKYSSFYDTVGDDFPCPDNMSNAFANQSKRTCIKHLDTSNVTTMENMFSSCKLKKFPDLDTSKVTTMRSVFQGNSFYIIDKPNWDTSNVTNMENMFNSCLNLVYFDVSNWDTSKVTTMYNMLYQTSTLQEIGEIDCSKVQKNKYIFQIFTDQKLLTNLGGFKNMKSSWDENYGLAKCPNLTYQSCINVLNGLYDFTGNGETPTSDQGKLKVHKNFLALVGDELSIGTNKGWTITA